MGRKASSGANLTAIAKQLGLSISTVSRALRDADGIHSETRSRVLEVAEAIGYGPPGRQAAALNAHPHNIMALAQCTAPFTDQRYLTGMSRASVSMNLAILSHHVTSSDCDNILSVKHQPAAMRAGIVEGVVLIHRWPSDVARRIGEKWPTVSIVHHYPDAKIDHIGIDDRMGVGKLVRHLHGNGHREIGFFGFCREMSWSCSRFAGYVEALVVTELSYRPKHVVEITLEDALAPGVFQPDAWGAQVMAAVKAGVKAWISASSATAFTLCRFLQDQGLRIPEDVEVAGYHQGSAVPFDVPDLTSTLVADEDLGAAALRRLIHRLQHPSESQRSILLPTQFLQGKTTRSA